MVGGIWFFKMRSRILQNVAKWGIEGSSLACGIGEKSVYDLSRLVGSEKVPPAVPLLSEERALWSLPGLIKGEVVGGSASEMAMMMGAAKLGRCVLGTSLHIVGGLPVAWWPWWAWWIECVDRLSRGCLHWLELEPLGRAACRRR